MGEWYIIYYACFFVQINKCRIGVGFGICHRLLLQLSRSQCTDALPRPEISSIYSAYGTDNIPLGPCDGLTLVLACRNFSRAKLAKDQLLQLLDDDIAKQRKLGTYDGHGDIFRKNLQIDIQLLDLASLSSVFKFGEEIVSKYACSVLCIPIVRGFDPNN